MKVLPAEGR